MRRACDRHDSRTCSMLVRHVSNIASTRLVQRRLPMRAALIMTSLMMGIASGRDAVAQDSRSVDSVTTAFRVALASGDVAKMKGHFADSVAFAGDVRFVGGTRETERMMVTR